MKRDPAARVANALRAFVQAEESAALQNYWPLADLRRPAVLTEKNRGPLDREWRYADPQGFERFKRGRAALRAREGRS